MSEVYSLIFQQFIKQLFNTVALLISLNCVNTSCARYIFFNSSAVNADETSAD